MLKLSPLGPSPKHQNHRLVRSPKLHSALEALHFWEFVTPTAKAAGVVHRWKTGPFFLQCGSAEPTRGHSRSPCVLIPTSAPWISASKLHCSLPHPFPGPHRFLSFCCIFLLASHKKGKVFCFFFSYCSHSQLQRMLGVPSPCGRDHPVHCGMFTNLPGFYSLAAWSFPLVTPTHCSNHQVRFHALVPMIQNPPS